MSLYEHLCVVAPGISFDRREALLATARSVDIETSVDSAIESVRAELRSLDASVPSRAAARERVAETESTLQSRRETVATVRGQMQVAAEGEYEAEYRAAIRALSEAETEHTAAKESLADSRERARNARECRDRKLRLEDRLGNLRRTARKELLTAVEPRVDEAISNLPETETMSFAAADPVSAALALVRVGRIECPVVLACRRFPDRDSAERWLRTPVYRL